MTTKILGALFFLFSLNALSCVTVKPQQRAVLSDPRKRESLIFPALGSPEICNFSPKEGAEIAVEEIFSDCAERRGTA